MHVQRLVLERIIPVEIKQVGVWWLILGIYRRLITIAELDSTITEPTVSYVVAVT